MISLAEKSGDYFCFTCMLCDISWQLAHRKDALQWTVFWDCSYTGVIKILSERAGAHSSLFKDTRINSKRQGDRFKCRTNIRKMPKNISC